MKDEKWKDDILRSMEGAKRAEPDPQLYTRIRERIMVPMQVVRRPYLAAAAACLALLLTANIWALSTATQKPAPTSSSTYQIEQAHFDLY